LLSSLAIFGFFAQSCAMATSFFTSRYSSYLCFFAQPCDYWWSNSYSGLELYRKRNSYSITFFLNSLVPLTERLEEFLRNRDIQVDLNAIQQQLQDQILAGLSAGIGYSLSTIHIFC